MSELAISKKVASIPPSATLAVTDKARELKEQGRPVIGFGAGEPDFPTPDYIVEAALKACQDPKNHKYSAGPGLMELREAVAAKTLRDSGYEVDPTNVMITNGGKQAVFTAFAVTLDPGDEVLLPAPYWTTYPAAIQLNDGVPVPVLAGSDQEYKVTVEQLEAARTDRSKVLLLCSPSNPTGAVYTPDELKEIGEWALEHNLWVLTDEIYEHLVYAGTEKAHIVSAVPELAERTIVMNGVSKTYAMTGWRVGWMIAPAGAAKAGRTYQSHLTSNVNNVAQRAALAAVSSDLSAVEEMRVSFDRRRQLMTGMLNDIEGVYLPEPKGAFYCYADVTGLLGREWGGKVANTSADLANIILEEAEVAVVPGEAFGTQGHIRLSYAVSDSDITEGVGRIQQLFA